MKGIFILAFMSFSHIAWAESQVHLFILSGQSNMANLNVDASFTPEIEKKFGKDNVLIVKDAHHGQPIESWYKEPKWYCPYIDLFINCEKKTRGVLYEQLINKVLTAMKDKKVTSITFIWMQGERDAKSKDGDKYKVRWEGLLYNLKADLGSEDLNFIIGRLSDFDMKNESYPHWTMIRDIQVSIAETSQFGAWVNTDTFNGENNNLHYTTDGYEKFGAVLSDRAIELITSPY